MKWLALTCMFVMTTTAFAKPVVKRIPAAESYKIHPCEADAISKSEKLLKFHFDDQSGFIPNFAIETSVTVKAPIKAAVGKGKLDVLEVQGSIYKADYRMRMIYAQIKGECALMGQEILEQSNPY